MFSPEFLVAASCAILSLQHANTTRIHPFRPNQPPSRYVVNVRVLGGLHGASCDLGCHCLGLLGHIGLRA